eukprot:3686303-Alexandrium_andersonii.AAC.1
MGSAAPAPAGLPPADFERAGSSTSSPRRVAMSCRASGNRSSPRSARERVASGQPRGRPRGFFLPR